MRTSTRAGRSFRPGLEGVEGRALTTALGAGALGGAAMREAVLARREARMAALRGDAMATPRGAGAGAESGIVALNRRPPARPGRLGGAPAIGPGLGQGLIRLTLPSTWVDYGVVTLWNNTNSQVNLAISASTYANGQYFNYTINPGQYRSFYATYTTTGVAPTFKVLFNPNPSPITLPQVNTIFQASNWVPGGTEGRPYAINVGVNGLFLSYI